MDSLELTDMQAIAIAFFTIGWANASPDTPVGTVIGEALLAYKTNYKVKSI